MSNNTEQIKMAFSAYALKAVKNARWNYLNKKIKLSNHEITTGDYGDIEDIQYFDPERYLAGDDYESLNTEKLMDQIQDLKLYQVIRSLREEQKTILLLRIVYEKSFGDIAEIIDCTESNAKDKYFNLIRKIRKMMGEPK